MSRMGVIVNDDPMEDALRLVRGQPRLLNDEHVIGSDQPKAVAVATINTAPQPRTDVGRWLDLERRRRDLEAELKTTITAQDGLRQQILERWSMDGTSSERADGFLVRLRRTLYPKIADKAALAVALQERGLTDLLTVDEKAFGAYVTTHDEEEKALPPEIRTHVSDRFERFALVVTLPGGNGPRSHRKAR